MATRKTTTRKKTVEKPAIVIDEDIEVGMLELPDSKGIRVALIRSSSSPTSKDSSATGTNHMKSPQPHRPAARISRPPLPRHRPPSST